MSIYMGQTGRLRFWKVNSCFVFIVIIVVVVAVNVSCNVAIGCQPNSG